MLERSMSMSMLGLGRRSGWLSIVTGICTEEVVAVVVAVVAGGRGEGKAQGVEGQLSSSCCCKEAELTGVVRFESTAQPTASGEKIELLGVLPVDEDADVVEVDVDVSEEEDAE